MERGGIKVPSQYSDTHMQRLEGLVSRCWCILHSAVTSAAPLSEIHGASRPASCTLTWTDPPAINPSPDDSDLPMVTRVLEMY